MRTDADVQTLRNMRTELDQAGLRDFASEHLATGKLVYLASLDIDGAFDMAPRRHPAAALEVGGAEPRLLRFTAKWLAGSRYSVKLRTSAGQFSSRSRPKSRGLPQGGVLSPLLWFLVVDKIRPRPEALREAEPEVFGEVERLDLIYADDIARLLPHPEAERLVAAATRNAQLIKQVLEELGLILRQPKSYNFIMSPGLILGSVFRREPNAHRLSNLNRPKLDREQHTVLTELPREGLDNARIFPGERREKLLCAWNETSKILGITLDPKLTFESHCERLMGRSKVRHGALAKLARSNWGLETGILWATYNALLVSVTRSGLATVGSGMYETHFRQMDTKHTNIAARRIAGMGISARLETLHVMAGTLSTAYLYLQTCAGLPDRALRADSSTVRTRLYRWLCGTFRVESWEGRPPRVERGSIHSRRTWTKGIWSTTLGRFGSITSSTGYQFCQSDFESLTLLSLTRRSSHGPLPTATWHTILGTLPPGTRWGYKYYWHQDGVRSAQLRRP